MHITLASVSRFSIPLGAILLAAWSSLAAAAAPVPVGYEGEVSYVISAPTASVHGGVALRLDKSTSSASSSWSYVNTGGHFKTAADRHCKTGDVVTSEVTGDLQSGLSDITGEAASQQFVLRIGFPHVPIRLTCTTSPGVSSPAPGDILQNACGEPIAAGVSLPARAARFTDAAKLEGYKVCTYPAAAGTRVNFIAWHLRALAETAAAPDASASSVPVDAAQSALAALSVSAGALSPAFDAATPVYYLSVAHAVEQIRVIATPADGAAKLAFYRPATMTHSNAANIALAVGTNAIPLTVTARDGLHTRAYVLQVTRAP
jgi:hypothetical protein